MQLENHCVVPADLETTWNLVTDITRVASCVPGLQDVTAVGENNFQGTLKVRVGPVSLSLAGKILVIARDREKWEAVYRVEAADRRVGGSVRADMSMRLTEQPDGQTELAINTDAAFMGKLGELGQPVIRHKARTTMDDFARNLAKEVSSTHSSSGASA